MCRRLETAQPMPEWEALKSVTHYRVLALSIININSTTIGRTPLNDSTLTTSAVGINMDDILDPIRDVFEGQIVGATDILKEHG